MPLSERFIALPIVYLVRLDELRLKKSFYKLFQANVCQSYGLETRPLQKIQLHSLDFVTNRLFMKLFMTTDIRIISLCQKLFTFELPSVQLERRCKKFVNKFSARCSI